MVLLAGLAACTTAAAPETDPDFFDGLFGDVDDTAGAPVTGYFAVQGWPASDDTVFDTYSVKGTTVDCAGCFYAFEGALFNDSAERSGRFLVTPIEEQLGPLRVGRLYLDGAPLGYAYPRGDGSIYVSNALTYYLYQLDAPPPQWERLYRGTFYY